MNWTEFWPPIVLSLRVASLSSLVAMAIGTAAAWWMSRQAFKGKTLLETFFMLPLVLPPTVVGLILLVLLGRRSWVGQTIEWIFSSPIIFSWWAAVIASIVVSFPLVYQTMKVGFGGIDRQLEESARSAGATEWQTFLRITLPLAYPAFFTAFVLAFARGLGEFGATLMIAGNIPGKTQTIPTAIFIASDSGHMTMAWSWTIAMIVLSFILLLLVGRRKEA
ncbi:molybdate ABC transporter permease subunit [Cohnella boryungensis]|uniref:Molybdenum transport system permease n=1 Tax=Cohnella boryungensis TaxID=768479 RepID=A0ABV8S7M7_9BACL